MNLFAESITARECLKSFSRPLKLMETQRKIEVTGCSKSSTMCFLNFLCPLPAPLMVV